MTDDRPLPGHGAGRCPECDEALDGPRCPRCGLLLTGDDAALLLRIDDALARLRHDRRAVLDRLRTASAIAGPGPPGTTAAATVPGAPLAAPFPPPPAPPAPPGGPVPPGPRRADWLGAAGPGLTLPHLLLGLGTGLMIVAAIVFTAVTWSRLGSAVQGLVLVGVTAAAGWGTWAIRRRGLVATAEALSVVTVALLPVDVHAGREAAQAFGWSRGPGGDPLPYWCLAIWALAATSWWFGRASGTRAPRMIAAAAAQVPVPLWVVNRPVAAVPGQLACLAQVGVVVVVAQRGRLADAWARAVALLGAAATWVVVAPAAAVLAFSDGTAERLGGAGVLAGAAAVAGLVAGLAGDEYAVRRQALGTATATGLAAAGIALSAGVTGAAWWPLAAATCGAVAVVAVRLPRRWGDPPAAVAAVLGAVVSLPLASAVLAGVAAAITAPNEAWRHDAGARVQAVADTTIDPAAGGLVVAHLAVLALAGLGLHERIGRRATAQGLVALASAGVIAAPFVADLPVGAAVALLLVVAGVATGWLARGGGCTQAHAPVAALTALAGTALLWASASTATTLVAVAAVGVLAAVVAAGALRDGVPSLARGAVVVAVAAACAEAGLSAAALGASDAGAWIAVGLTAAAVTLAVAAVDPPGTRRDLLGALVRVGEGAAASIHLVGLAAVAGLGSTGAVTTVLAAGAGVAALHGLRPGRWPVAALWAAAEVLVLAWLHLARAGVEAPEAYAAPVAALLLAGAVEARRRGLTEGRPSWTVHGPWLTAALAPTALLGVDDPGLVRPLGGLAIGVVVLVVGAVTRQRAPVDVGAASVALLAAGRLAPVVGSLPNWATLGTCGLVLLVVGATFEERRRNVTDLLDRYAALG